MPGTTTFTRACLITLLLAGARPVQAGVIFTDDFDPINSGQWASIRGGSATGSGQSGFDFGNALHFSGNNNRLARTVGMDLTLGGTVSFDFRGGNEDIDGTTFWEDVDPGENAILEYRATGSGGWIQFATLDLVQFVDDSPTTTWLSMNLAVPVAAQSANTRFRWSQPTHSGAGFDHWAIDNVQITANPEPSTMVLIGTAFACGWARRRRRAGSEESDSER